MRVICAFDKFKSNRSAHALCAFLRQWSKGRRGVELVVLPMADGGEGSLNAAASYLPEMKIKSMRTVNAVGNSILAPYGIWQNKAFVQLSDSAGLAQIEKVARDCMGASTLGTGWQLKEILKKENPSEMNLFLGGSATTDGGLGILTALGIDFYNAKGNKITPSGASMQEVRSFQCSEAFQRYESVQWNLYCDVTNPFFGPNGAAQQYSPQKGASASEVEQLDRGLSNLAAIYSQHKNIGVQSVEGAGAAGGVAGGILAFFKARVCSGAGFFIQLAKLDTHLKNADMVITAEGCFDATSLNGKLPYQVLVLAGERPIERVLVAGAIQATEWLEANKVRYEDLSVIAKENNLNSFEDIEECLEIALSKILKI